MRNEYLPQLSKLLYNSKLKNKEAHLCFKGLSKDGGSRIFLKIKINKDLSNEPNFGRIHLVGQYLL
jgi:hypothetical protein